MMIFAHRGLHNSYTPENSMLAFKKAEYRKIPIELDVRLLKTGEIVVFHDLNLWRMTGINKNIEKCSYEEIKELKLKDTNYSIPLLEDVLREINNKVTLLIEVKTTKIKVIKKLIKLLDNYDNFLIQSFNKKIIYFIKKLRPTYKVGLLSFKVKNKYDFVAIPKEVAKKINTLLIIWNISLDEIVNYRKYTNTFIVDY